MSKFFQALGLSLFISLAASAQENYVSKVWVADQGNGTYRNPIIYADYSDPDAIRVGDDFYMTASSFNCVPGLPILHSKDLVNWSIVSAAIPYTLDDIAPDSIEKPQHGNRVWAPSIRYHDNEYYIYWGDPDQGIFMTKAKDVNGPWCKPILVEKTKGFIDTTPLWDDDGHVYLVHAMAGSRAGLKSVICVDELSADGTSVIAPSRIVFDGHEGNETCEGPKFYKRNGYYYIFTPAGGVSTGWQLVLRSKNVYGPYEQKIVLRQGKTNINGPHQGAWVTTQTGEDWFLHFQDVGPKGRILNLEPMKWINDWPVIGEDKDGDGCGQPVSTYRKPNVGKTYPVCTPQESDEFSGVELGKQWQWQGNYNPRWIYCDGRDGYIRLYSYPVCKDYKSLWDVPNLLLQKMPADEFTVTMKMKFQPNPQIKGERAGLVIMGMDYAALSVTNTPDGPILSQDECIGANKGKTEKENAECRLKQNELYLRTVVTKDNKATFYYSYDNKKFVQIGNDFSIKEGLWIGAKMGMFCTRTNSTINDSGWMQVDWFRVTK